MDITMILCVEARGTGWTFAILFKRFLFGLFEGTDVGLSDLKGMRMRYFLLVCGVVRRGNKVAVHHTTEK